MKECKEEKKKKARQKATNQQLYKNHPFKDVISISLVKRSPEQTLIQNKNKKSCTLVQAQNQLEAKWYYSVQHHCLEEQLHRQKKMTSKKKKQRKKCYQSR